MSPRSGPTDPAHSSDRGDGGIRDTTVHGGHHTTGMGCDEVEDCQDGVDNNCDGKIDCQDPQCTPDYQCAPNPPPGWVAFAFSESVRSDCPSGYVSSTDIVVNPRAETATCECQCASRARASCVDGDGRVYSTSSPGSVVCPESESFRFQGRQGACIDTDASEAVVLASFARITPLTPVHACIAVPRRVDVQSVEARLGRLCAALPNSSAGGCSKAAACVPIAREHYSRCVKSDGVVDCPTGYPQRYAAADSVKDTRGCTDCRCESTATCDKQALAVYGDTECSGDKMTFSATGVCGPTGAQTPVRFRSYRYAAEVKNEGCNKTGGGESVGTVSLVHEMTICCQ